MEDSEIYALVRTVPAGCVATYGQVAGLLTTGAVTARMVGAAMRYAPPDVPWQRVVGAGGKLPIAKLGPELRDRQRRLLEAEGVTFKAASDTVNMGRHQWRTHRADMATEAETGDLFDGANTRVSGAEKPDR